MSAPTPPTFSVVLCVYTEERWEDIERALASIEGQALPALETIVVVDHNPSLRDRLKEARPDLRVVENDGQRGLSDARNRGVREAAADVIVFLDDDAAAEPDWLARFAAVYADPSVIGVGGAAHPVWERGDRPGWFPAEFDWVVGCSYRGLPEERAPIRNFLGCNMSFRREAFRTVGGFDTSVGRVGTRPVGGEETELCIRVRRAFPGTELVYEPAAAVRHRVPASRSTFRYFRQRCYAEGISKAIVGRLAGTDAGLASERRHAAVTLPRGALGELVGAVRHRQASRLLRAAAIVAGLAITVAGYAHGVVVDRARARRTSAADRTAR